MLAMGGDGSGLRFKFLAVPLQPWRTICTEFDMLKLLRCAMGMNPLKAVQTKEKCVNRGLHLS